jgi:hypothetical protein
MANTVIASKADTNPLSIQEYNLLHRHDDHYRDAVSVLREVRMAAAMRHHKNLH